MLIFNFTRRALFDKENSDKAPHPRSETGLESRGLRVPAAAAIQYLVIRSACVSVVAPIMMVVLPPMIAPPSAAPSAVPSAPVVVLESTLTVRTMLPMGRA